MVKLIVRTILLHYFLSTWSSCWSGFTAIAKHVNTVHIPMHFHRVCVTVFAILAYDYRINSSDTGRRGTGLLLQDGTLWHVSAITAHTLRTVLMMHAASVQVIIIIIGVKVPTVAATDSGRKMTSSEFQYSISNSSEMMRNYITVYMTSRHQLWTEPDLVASRMSMFICLPHGNAQTNANIEITSTSMCPRVTSQIVTVTWCG